MANDKRFLGILSFAVLTAVAPARAQTAPPPAASPSPATPAPPASPPAASPPGVSPPAVAGGDGARADALFQDGKRLLEQGKTDEACTLLAHSDAIEPAVSTLGLLAACHEQQGRIATAVKEYRETARRAAAAGDSRGEFAQQRAVALAPRLPRLVIHVARTGPPIELLRNGASVPASEVGAEIPVDPGSYEIVARAAGRREHRVVVVAVEGVAVHVEVPELALDAPPRDPTALPSNVGPPSPGAAQTSSGPRPMGLVLGGVGVAGLGFGVGFGVAALNLNLDSKKSHDTCRGPDACANGRALRSSAYTAATASTISLSVGAVGLVTGLVVLFWPSRKAPAPARTGLHVMPLTGPRGGGAALGGSF